MNRLTLLALSLFIFPTCNYSSETYQRSNKPIHLKIDNKEEEQRICGKIDLDTNIAKQLMDLTKNTISQIPMMDEGGQATDSFGLGVISKVEYGESNNIIRVHKEEFKKKGYLLFVYENDKSERFLALLKGTDEYDILRYIKTNGINHGIETRDIIARLKKWNKDHDFVILGASMDWLEIEFITTPTNLDTYTEEVYAFCPDVVDQGTGDLKTLKSEIIRTRGMFFWWD